eukprot:gene6791-30759_t
MGDSSIRLLMRATRGGMELDAKAEPQPAGPRRLAVEDRSYNGPGELLMEQLERPPKLELPDLSRENRVLLTRVYQKRTKSIINVFLGCCVAGCLIYDWDTYLGTDKHVFSPIRPAIRRNMDWWYGVGRYDPSYVPIKK